MLRRIAYWMRWKLARWPFFGELVREAFTNTPLIFGGPRERVELGVGVVLADATLNVSSGRISLGDHTFCGHGVTLVTGTHDVTKRGLARGTSFPPDGRDITIGAGVWLGSNVTVIGPCMIGDDAVVAAGAVVTRDVAPGTIVAGVPARVVREVIFQD
jgi:acetyltransferase-like isoleucine patch superfamily enzyme